MTPRTKVQGDAEHRAFQAWSMRVRGYSWREVAAELGYSDHSNAIRAVRNVFGDVPDIAGHRDELRDLWGARPGRLDAQGCRGPREPLQRRLLEAFVTHSRVLVT